MNAEYTHALEKYRQLLPTYEAFATRLETLLKDLFEAGGLKLHFTESRAKSIESLKEKINRPEKSYNDLLTEVPDLVGIRAILYYQDDIDKAGEILKKEFEIIEEEGEHQPDKYSPDQFGYISMHYIIVLKENNRANLAEWKAFQGIKAEIQVRTLLQHSWAAVSHALQYKREGDVPIMLRRKLFRLAGLFEMADEQFVDIRYERERITRISKESVHGANQNIRIDAPALKEFINISPSLNRIVDKMKEIGYVFEENEERFEKFIGLIVEECERLGVRTFKDLEMIINKDYETFLLKIFLGPWTLGASFALYLILIASHPDAFTVDNLRNQGWDAWIAERVVEGARGMPKK